MFKFYVYLTTLSTFSTQKEKYLELFENFNCKPIVDNYNSTSAKCLWMISGLKIDTKCVQVFKE